MSSIQVGDRVRWTESGGEKRTLRGEIRSIAMLQNKQRKFEPWFVITHLNDTESLIKALDKNLKAIDFTVTFRG